MHRAKILNEKWRSVISLCLRALLVYLVLHSGLTERNLSPEAERTQRPLQLTAVSHLRATTKYTWLYVGNSWICQNNNLLVCAIDWGFNEMYLKNCE